MHIFCLHRSHVTVWDWIWSDWTVLCFENFQMRFWVLLCMNYIFIENFHHGVIFFFLFWNEILGVFMHIFCLYRSRMTVWESNAHYWLTVSFPDSFLYSYMLAPKIPLYSDLYITWKYLRREIGEDKNTQFWADFSHGMNSCKQLNWYMFFLRSQNMVKHDCQSARHLMILMIIKTKIAHTEQNNLL